MIFNQFIFSNKLKYKLARHLTFWLVFSAHFVVQNLMIGGPGEGKTSRTFFQSFFHFLYFLPVYFLSTYFFIEILLPAFFFKRRYVGFIISFLLLFSIVFLSVYYSGVFYLHNTLKLPLQQITFGVNKYHAVVDGMFVPFMLLSIAAGIKFSKKWHLQQKENERLAKNKIATELQILKTSLHPRFLLHSLHTVQQHINHLSDQSPALILELSDLLSYILYENNENWVLLEKELEIVRCYINLEEKGFDNKLFFKTEYPQNTKDKFIIPFLLLSIIESSFEYFFETAQKEPSLILNAHINESTLYFTLIFSKSTESILPNQRFASIQKQLQNQYPGLHSVSITSDLESVSFILKVPLYSGELINLKKNITMNELQEA